MNANTVLFLRYRLCYIAKIGEVSKTHCKCLYKRRGKNYKYFCQQFENSMNLSSSLFLPVRQGHLSSFSSFTCSLSSIRWYISVLHFNNFKIQFQEVTPLHCVLSIKYTFTCQDDTFKPANMNIPFLCKICYLFL